jgi:ABC-type sugar transport system, permease component
MKPKKLELFDVVNYLLLTLAAFIILYPLYLIVIASVSDPNAIVRGEVLFIPKDISMVGYKRVFSYAPLWRSYINTIIYTVVGTSINIILTMMAAYSLTRRFAGKKFISFYITFTMFFGGGLIPTFLLVKQVGLYNNPMVMIIMGAVSVWNIIVARTFFESNIPEELFEAAVMDGCSHFRYLFSIVLPLSKAIIAVLVVYYAVGHWNDFMTGLIYLKSRKYLPLQVILRDLLASLQVSSEMGTMFNDIVNLEEMVRVSEAAKYCIIIVSSIPVLLLYMFMQKYFVKGVMIGSVKG